MPKEAGGSSKCWGDFTSSTRAIHQRLCNEYRKKRPQHLLHQQKPDGIQNTLGVGQRGERNNLNSCNWERKRA